MILRCTSKLLAQLGSRSVALVDAPPADDDWYVNLLWIDGKKCLLLTHAGTLFPAFVPAVRKADLRQLGQFLSGVIATELRSEGLPPGILGPLDPENARLAKTASRSILGFMNDSAYHCEYAIEAHGGLNHCDTDGLNYRLRRTLHNRGGYIQPMDLVAQRLTDR